MADQVLPGIGGLLVTFAILNSCLANASSGATAATRAIFSLGRSGLIPRAVRGASTRRTGRPVERRPPPGDLRAS